MPASSLLPAARQAGAGAELAALRTELSCILQHPAIAPARQQMAEPFIDQCTDAAQLRHWLALAVQECGRWEDEALVAEASSRH